MNSFFFYLLLSLLGTSCMSGLSDTKNREKPSNPISYKDSLGENQKVLFSYSFRNDPTYEYTLISEQDTIIELPSIYAVLLHKGKEVDRHILNNKYGHYLEKAKLAKAMLKPKIQGIDEMVIFSNKEDNEQENAEGESSESIESSTFSMIFGRSNNSLIEEVYSWSYYSFWYEGVFDYEAIGKEGIYFPEDEKGMDNHLVIETSIDHNRWGRYSDGRQDICTEKYYVKKKLIFENGKWKNANSIRKKINTESLINVYAAPTLCLETIIGTIRPSDGLKILEVSEITSEHIEEYGDKVKGGWIKIEFPHEEGFENIGYIHLYDEEE